ncbi:hypothetical protein BDA96_02G126800 [Sorghum bicolor]|uniref:Uncharacterized protein n=2 Tax=Sorghum bicolor TaxID=4558 RepID=A0A921UTG3_SORBI|nr:hypothetical protein BDA96_02G126800 [Sorghum bicolor]KXG35005.1 hypothetical protein SORBI_3002G120900 [Sorghum bicolor]
MAMRWSQPDASSHASSPCYLLARPIAHPALRRSTHTAAATPHNGWANAPTMAEPRGSTMTAPARPPCPSPIYAAIAHHSESSRREQDHAMLYRGEAFVHWQPSLIQEMECSGLHLSQ